MRSTDLEAAKVEELTEDIPFEVYAEVVIRVHGSIYAKSEMEACKVVVADPQLILDSQSSSHMSASNVRTDLY